MADDKNILRFTTKAKIKVLDSATFEEMEVSQASIDAMLPEGYDASMNMDIMPVVFNLAVVNEINANDDAMNSLAAIKCVKSFANKPINIEHKRHKIVGHMINASLSENEFDFGDNDLESFADKTEPFYLNAFGFIYRKIFPDLAAAIVEASNEDSEEYQTISTSWELASKQFKLIKGNSKKIAECEYVAKEDYEEYMGYLRKFGGTGKDKFGSRVARVFYGDIIPLGAGLTLQPAARVKGVYPVDSLQKTFKQEKEVANQQKNSQLYKKDVTTNKSNILNMDEKQFEEFMKGVTEAIASVVKKDSEVKSIGQTIHDSLKAHAETWESKVQAEAQARQEAQEALASLKEAKEKIEGELAEIKSEMEAKAAAEAFNARMNYFDDKYELSEAEQAIVAAELKSVKEDSEFEAVQAKMDVLFAHKDKEVLAKAKEEEEARIEAAIAKRDAEKTQSAEATEATASTEIVEETETEIETEEASAALPNGNGEQTQQKSLFERAKESFKATIS